MILAGADRSPAAAFSYLTPGLKNSKFHAGQAVSSETAMA
jgi:hypothetical protein